MRGCSVAGRSITLSSSSSILFSEFRPREEEKKRRKKKPATRFASSSSWTCQLGCIAKQLGKILLFASSFDVLLQQHFTPCFLLPIRMPRLCFFATLLAPFSLFSGGPVTCFHRGKVHKMSNVAPIPRRRHHVRVRKEEDECVPRRQKKARG